MITYFEDVLDSNDPSVGEFSLKLDRVREIGLEGARLNEYEAVDAV